MARFELAADKTCLYFKNEKSFIFHLVIFSGSFDNLVSTYTHISSLIGIEERIKKQKQASNPYNLRNKVEIPVEL